MAKVSIKKITETIHEAVAGKKGNELKSAVNGVVELLAQKNLLSKGSEILARLEKMLDADSNTLRAKLISQQPLTRAELKLISETLKQRYESEDVVFDLKEDTTLLGGVRIEVNNEVIDLSLKNKVEQLRDNLLAL
jgi:F-type H+-transporting ATPase subunit delta